MLGGETKAIHKHINESKIMAKQPFHFYVRKNKRKFIFGISSLLFTNGLDALPPLLVGMAVDQISQGEPFIKTFGLLSLLVVIALTIAVFRYAWRIQWGQYSHGAARDLKDKIFSKYLNLDQKFFQKNTIGKLMSLINNDVNAFRMAIGPGVLVLLDALFISAFVIPLMIYLSPSLTWKTLIFLPVIPFVIARIEKLIHEYYKKQQNQFSELSATTQEILSGIRTIKSFAQEKNYEKKFNHESKKLEQYANKVAKLDAAFSPTLELSVSIGCVILLFFAADDVFSGTLTIGALLSFYQYLQKMMWPMAAIGIGLTFWQKGMASIDRVTELLSEDNKTPDLGTKTLSAFESFELKNLNFKHEQESPFQLTNINIKILPGEIIGFLGKTGSGKSTITDLISGLYPTEKGQILINGENIQDFTQESIHNFITYVPQDTFLFSDDIFNNTLLSTEKKQEHVIDVLKTVQINDEIEKMDKKHKTVLGEKGINISGGQRQRLALARGLIRDTRLLILDDTFSAIDANTEKLIIDAIKKRLHNLSVIIISHKLASLKLADRVYVLNDGAVEAVGNHNQLMQDSSTYKSIYKSQIDGGPI